MSPRPQATHDSLRLGISVSEPADSDLISRGLSQMHVRHAFIELARHLLAAGHTLAYGGDFRQQGYTEAMLDLVQTYVRRDQPGPGRIIVYSAWPHWVGLDPEERAAIVSLATLVQVDPPIGAPERLPPPADRTPAERLWAALALTEMRKQMNGDLDARVLIGGRLSGQVGLLPGVVEEAVLSVEDSLPIFVIGGFGGAASLVGQSLRAEVASELSLEYQRDNTIDYAEIWEEAGRRRVRPDFNELRERFSQSNQADLNGLSSEQNAQLLMTSDIDEILALVLRGLRAIMRK